MVALHAIATAPGVARLAFGSLDYMADLDIPADGLALDFAAVAAQAARIFKGFPKELPGLADSC